MSDSTDKDLPKDPPDGDLPDGQQLDEYLRGGSAVSRQYRQLRSEDVPAELDRLVLRQAQEAVKIRPTKSRAWVRWTGPLALAASAVLVVSIVIESGVSEKALLTVPASAPIETRVQEEPAEKTVESGAVESAVPDAGTAQDKAVASDARDATAVVPIVPVDPGAPAEIQIESAPMAPAPIEESRQSQDRMFVRARIRPAAPPPPVAAPQPESTPPAEKLETPPPASARREQAYAIPQAANAISAPAPAPAREADSSEDDLASVVVTSGNAPSSVGDEEAARTVQGSLRGEQSRIAGPRNTVASPASASERESGADEQDEAPRSYSDPEQWLRDIRQLRKEKKHDNADREWRRFRSAFPNYSVAESDPARGAVR